MTFWTKAAGKAESITPEAKRENKRDGEMEEQREGVRREYITLHSTPCHLHGVYSPRHTPCK